MSESIKKLDCPLMVRVGQNTSGSKIANNYIKARKYSIRRLSRALYKYLVTLVVRSLAPTLDLVSVLMKDTKSIPDIASSTEVLNSIKLITTQANE